MTADKIEQLWYEIRELTPGTAENRLAMGERFHALRQLYSQKSADVRRLSGPGIFEQEIVNRGYRPRTVREWISDYEASVMFGYHTSSAKRKARRQREKAFPKEHPLTAFAELLPVAAAQAAYREAAKIYHPDRGGDESRMQALNVAWERAKEFYAICDVMKDVIGNLRRKKPLTEAIQ